MLKTLFKQKPKIPTQNKQKKIKEKPAERKLPTERKKGLEVDHVVKVDGEVPFIEHIY